MRVVRRFGLAMGVCVVLVATVLAGCNLLQYQFCINNLTSFDLTDVNIVNQGADSWGANDLSAVLAPGGSEDIKGFAAGTYMVRGVFDVADSSEFCDDVINDELIVVNEGIDITTTNVCIDYREDTLLQGKAVVIGGCTLIYGDVRFVI
ncbi:MAG: hypothetical protein K1Y02_10590 [Candidatus Hydrogenedentes bacterium]|nr:hypothetical protein [Candidatus Hydrogenedentota bacterium]